MLTNTATKVLETRANLTKECAQNYADMFRRRVEQTPDKTAYTFPSYTEPEEWRSITWAQTKTDVDVLAAGLLSLGLEWEQRVGLASSTRIEWVLMDLAIACAGAATTTIYPTTRAEDEAFILQDAGCVFLVAEDAEQVAKVLDHEALSE